MSRSIPEPWASAMTAAGFTDPRDGVTPSMRRLAERASTTPSTISAMVHGDRDTNGDVIERVAVALGMADRADEVTRWVGRSRSQPRPFQPHRDANLLTTEEQEAVNEMIRLFALTKRKAGEEHVDARSAATKTPEVGPADQPTRVDITFQNEVTLAADEGDRDPRDEAEETERST